jgi:hypothetical protein
MINKLCFALLVGVFALALAASNIIAQVGVTDTTLTDKDIDLFIKYATASSTEEQVAAFQGSGLDAAKWAAAQGKLTTYLGIVSTGQPAATVKAMLSSLPYKYSDAELALINAKEKDLVAAYKKMTGALK